MHNFRRITDQFYVAPQIQAADVDTAVENGFGVLIMNRPDRETPDQPALSEIVERAAANNIPFIHIPIIAPPELEDIEKTVQVLRESQDKKILAFCRSGTRSVTLWAYAMAFEKALSVEDILFCAQNGGYDLSPHRPRLDAVFALK